MQRATSYRYIIRLTRFRNAYLPVGNLAPEILSEIFLTVNPEGYSRQLSSVIMSHVCYAWRAVALSLPRLWSLVWMNDRPMARMQLDRCRSGSISIFSGLGQQTGAQEDKDLLDPHITQIQKFHAVHDTQEMYKLIQYLHRNSFPSLSELNLKMPSQYMLQSYNEPERTWSLTWTPYCENFTALRSMTLAGVHIPLDSRVFVNLTHLFLHYQ